jgi:DNA-binding CsgD family transcriptional regulator/tetratricopeptide (TPR) repeat protein
MGKGAADIAALLPEVHDKLPVLPPLPPLDPGEARFRLFDSLATFFKKASESCPLLIVLEDLHWSDRSSLLLWEFISKEISTSKVMLLGTYRGIEVGRRHPLSQTLGTLIREPNFRRIALGGLSRQDAGRFVELSGGVTLTASNLELIHNRTEGNPLFLNELVRLLGEEGMEATDSWANSLPEGVKDVIGRRLDRLSERCNNTLTIASVIGREFILDQLTLLSDQLSEDALLEVLEEALASRVIEEIPPIVGHYQFTHALIQETLAEELSTTRRVRLHARIAEMLEELYGDDAEYHAAELAYHFSQAEAMLGTGRLVVYSLKAGEQALASSAYEDALTHFEKGLVARNITVPGTEPASDEEAAALLFGLARAQSATVVGRQVVEVFAILSRAFEYYFQSGNVAQAVTVAEFQFATPGFLIPGLAELLVRALTLVPAESHDAGRLLSRYGGIVGIDERDYQGAQKALEGAIAISRREGDVGLEMRTLIYAAAVSGRHLNWRESVDSGLRAIELATGDDTPWSIYGPRYWTAQGLLYLGDLEAARPHALALRDLAKRRSTPRVLASYSFISITSLSCLVGDWEAGRGDCDSALEISPLIAHLLGNLAMLEHQTGESAQGEIYLEQLLEAMRRGEAFASVMTSMAIPAVARITGVPDHLDIAEAAAEEVLSERSVTANRAMYAKTGLALLAVQKGDRSAAEKHYDDFLEQQGHMMWTVSSVDRLLGLLSQTMGNLDQAATHFEEALSFCRKSGCRPELAWTCCDYAGVLSDGKGPGDRTKIVTLLDEALAISTELGMRPLMDRAKERLERVDSRPVPAPAYPECLTQREVEVLRLIAAGKTDREISEDLFIGVRTVSTHVSNILSKISAANRTEAASYANQQGLV